MKKAAEAKLMQGIDELERQRKVRMINTAIAVVLILGFLFLMRPDLSQVIPTENLRNSFKSLIPERSEEVQAEEEPVVEEEEEAEAEVSEPKPGTVIKIGSVTEFRGNDIILSYVSSKETYCSFRVDGESILITTGTSRTIQGITIKVLEPSLNPSETCRVELR